MASATLPIELAALFLAPADAAALESCSRALRASAVGYWKAFYELRYPALASLPGLGQPSNARWLVRSLHHATPPTPIPRHDILGDPPYPPAPRDGEGRALPLRGDTILAVQLSRLGRQRPVAYGSVRLADTQLHLRSTGPTPANDAWTFDVDLTHGRAVHESLGLPETIAIKPDEPLAVSSPPFRGVIASFLESFDQNLKPEIYIVAGDRISRMDSPCSCLDDYEMEISYHDFVQLPLEHWAQRGEVQTDSVTRIRGPWLPMTSTFQEMNAALETRWTVGYYEVPPESVDHFLFSEQVQLQVCFRWEDAGWNGHFEGGPGDDQWNWFSQLLASASPVLFPRQSVTT